MATIKQYRTPVFTYGHAEGVWGSSYWALSGKQMLDWLIATQARTDAPRVHSMYEHRPSFSPTAARNMCWCMKPKVGEIPDGITETYSYDISKYPTWMNSDQKIEYLLQKSWALLFFKWDSMSVEPNTFNLLLAKVLAAADDSKIGLAILDTKDLYVNFNPVEWGKKYSDPYPVADLDAQKALYEQWLTWSGFRRYYTAGAGTKIVATPWYFRAPVENSSYGVGIKEYPPYQPHPLQVTGGTYYPNGYEKP